MELTTHTIFDVLAYAAGAWLFLQSNRSSKNNPVPPLQLLVLAIGAFGGGIIAARLLVQFESGIPVTIEAFTTGFGAGGKSIVGGLLGGILGIKLVKRFFMKKPDIKQRRSFGDRTIIPIGVGLCIARIGCFLSGLNDDTYGKPTGLPIGFDFGDGLNRHPTQLYEIIGIAAIVGLILFFWGKAKRSGDRFGWFLFGFCVLRFGLEFIRIHPTPYFGLSVYQLLCLVGAVWALKGKF